MLAEAQAILPLQHLVCVAPRSGLSGLEGAREQMPAAEGTTSETLTGGSPSAEEGGLAPEGNEEGGKRGGGEGTSETLTGRSPSAEEGGRGAKEARANVG